MPMKVSGLRLALARPPIGRVEVLVAKIASGGRMLGAAGGFGLDGGVLEHRLDNQVAAGERSIVRGGEGCARGPRPWAVGAGAAPA